MSKLPDDITSVRIDKESYLRFKEFCDEKGLLAPKQIGFILEGLLKEEMFDLLKAGWKIVEQRKSRTLKDAKCVIPASEAKDEN